MSLHIEKFLSGLPFFQELNPNQLKEVAKLFNTQSFKQGTYLFHENDPAYDFYIVISGEVSVQRNGTDGRPKIITSYKPGDFFGEVALFSNAGRSASVYADTDVQLLSLNKDYFHSMMEKYPSFGKYFNTLLSKRIQSMNKALSGALGSEASKFQITEINQMNKLLSGGTGKLSAGQVADLIAEANFKHEKDLVIGKEPLELFEGATELGEKRLERSWGEMALSGLIAGINVAFGALAASTAAGLSEPFVGELPSILVGALFFPVGFIFLALGRAELFTENFLLPVAAVLEGKASGWLLLKLWPLTLFFNMIGALFFAFLITRAHEAVLRPVSSDHIIHVGLSKVSHSFETTMIAGILAGMLITLMTWLLLACDSWISKIAVIWMVGFMINLNGFNHIVVNSFEIFYTMFKEGSISVSQWIMVYAIPVILGNTIGGILFVTMLVYLQAQAQKMRKKRELEEERATRNG